MKAIVFASLSVRPSFCPSALDHNLQTLLRIPLISNVVNPSCQCKNTVCILDCSVEYTFQHVLDTQTNTFYFQSDRQENKEKFQPMEIEFYFYYSISIL